MQGLQYVLLYLLLSGTSVLFQPRQSAAPQNSGTPTASQQTDRDGQHDFDFSFGNWKTHIKRLQHPLSGSATWMDYEGTSVVRKIWNGHAGLGETQADGPAGHLEAMSLRLYAPDAHQWNLTYASGQGGTLSATSSGKLETDAASFSILSHSMGGTFWFDRSGRI
jgi:hypothetical protein